MKKHDYIHDMFAIAEVLSACPEVTRYDTRDSKEAWTLAHAFVDLKESFELFLNEYLPKFTKREVRPEEVNDLLLDIGEEFRHILYHLRDPKFYRYLSPAHEENE